jgi:hypothetical protein
MKAQASSRPQRKTGEASAFRSARQFPWTKQDESLLGSMSDREVAERLGIGLAAVKSRRLSRGIEAANPRKAWTPAEKARLSKRPDATLARELGRTHLAVATQRRMLGILVFRPSRRPS